MYLTLLEQTGREGLTFARIVADIPHDGAAFFIYALTVLSLWLIWQGSRTGDRRQDVQRGEHGQGITPKVEGSEVEDVA